MPPVFPEWSPDCTRGSEDFNELLHVKSEQTPVITALRHQFSPAKVKKVDNDGGTTATEAEVHVTVSTRGAGLMSMANIGSAQQDSEHLVSSSHDDSHGHVRDESREGFTNSAEAKPTTQLHPDGLPSSSPLLPPCAISLQDIRFSKPNVTEKIHSSGSMGDACYAVRIDHKSTEGKQVNEMSLSTQPAGLEEAASAEVERCVSKDDEIDDPAEECRSYTTDITDERVGSPGHASSPGKEHLLPGTQETVAAQQEDDESSNNAQQADDGEGVRISRDAVVVRPKVSVRSLAAAFEAHVAGQW
jgi:hypothetical protein